MAALNPRKKKKNIEIQKQTSWCNLPDDMICLILNRFHYIDRIRFRAVCKGWRQANLQGCVKSADRLPWRIAIDSNSCYLFDPFHKQEHTIQTSSSSGVLFNSKIIASKHGWILLFLNVPNSSFDYAPFFYNPFTNEKIQVPKFHRYLSRGTFTTSPTCLDCEIYVVNGYHKRIHIGIYRFGGDGRWSEFSLDIDEDYSLSDDVEYVDGVLYTSNMRRTAIDAFNVALKEWKIYPYPSKPNDSFWCFDANHFINLNGNLLIASYRQDHGCIVYRLDGSEVENLVDLGTLFLDPHSSFFIPIPEEEISGLMAYQDAKCLDLKNTHEKGKSNISIVHYRYGDGLKKAWIQTPQLR